MRLATETGQTLIGAALLSALITLIVYLGLLKFVPGPMADGDDDRPGPFVAYASAQRSIELR